MIDLNTILHLRQRRDHFCEMIGTAAAPEWAAVFRRNADFYNELLETALKLWVPDLTGRRRSRGSNYH